LALNWPLVSVCGLHALGRHQKIQLSDFESARRAELSDVPVGRQLVDKNSLPELKSISEMCSGCQIAALMRDEHCSLPRLSRVG
jgi:hypothetical protein